MDDFGAVADQKVEAVFANQTDIIRYLSNSNGLYISDIVLREEIKETPLVVLLNTLHFTYCGGDCNKEGLYVWMDLGETVFATTKQENGFSAISLNNISRAFYDKCLKKNARPNIGKMQLLYLHLFKYQK